MPTSATAREIYSETEAAQSLGITLAELYRLLDQHIFTDGSPRPQRLEFRYADLLLVGVWSNSSPKLLRMPRRN